MRIYIITDLINYIKILIMNYRIDNDKIELLTSYIELVSYYQCGYRHNFIIFNMKKLSDKNYLKAYTKAKYRALLMKNSCITVYYDNTIEIHYNKKARYVW